MFDRAPTDDCILYLLNKSVRQNPNFCALSFNHSLREKCPNTDLKKTLYLDTFHAVIFYPIFYFDPLKTKDFLIFLKGKQKGTLGRKGLSIAESFGKKTIYAGVLFGYSCKFLTCNSHKKPNSQLFLGNLPEIFLNRYSVERLLTVASINNFLMKIFFIHDI